MHILEAQPSIICFEQCYRRYLFSDCPIAAVHKLEEGKLSPVTPHTAIISSAIEALSRLRLVDDLNYTICQIYIRSITEYIFLRPNTAPSKDFNSATSCRLSLPEMFTQIVESNKARLIFKLRRFKEENEDDNDVKYRLFDEIIKCAQKLLRYHIPMLPTVLNEEEYEKEIKQLLGSVHVSKKPDEYISLSDLAGGLL